MIAALIMMTTVLTTERIDFRSSVCLGLLLIQITSSIGGLSIAMVLIGFDMFEHLENKLSSESCVYDSSDFLERKRK